jgi:hypothetical protein
MPASAAQVAANRLNAQRSTGPRTLDGKARSRQNALKHGLAAQLVVPDEDVAEVAERFADYERDLKPSSAVARFLVQQAAVMALNVERAQRADAAVACQRFRGAVARYDDERLRDVEDLVRGLLGNPRTNARRLQSTPEGVDWLIENWGDLKEDLLDEQTWKWSANHTERVENLFGRWTTSIHYERSYVLGRASEGILQGLRDDDGAGLDDHARMLWARRELAKLIDQEVIRLQELRSRFNFEALELDRVEAGRRGLVDTSTTASIAHRYQAAALRGFYRAIKEVERLERQGIGATDESPETSDKLASFGAEVETADPSPPDPTPPPAKPPADTRPTPNPNVAWPAPKPQTPQADAPESLAPPD